MNAYLNIAKVTNKAGLTFFARTRKITIFFVKQSDDQSNSNRV